jgi:hypothetical protein
MPSSTSNRYKTRFSRPNYHGKKPQIRRSRQDAGATREKSNSRQERVRVEAKQHGMRRWLLVAQAEAYATCAASLCPAPSRLGFSLVAPASCRLFCQGDPKVNRQNKRRRSRVGRYVYDRGGAELSCECAKSDYDVRSLRCALVARGVFWKGLSVCAAVVEFSYRSTWWL